MQTSGPRKWPLRRLLTWLEGTGAYCGGSGRILLFWWRLERLSGTAGRAWVSVLAPETCQGGGFFVSLGLLLQIPASLVVVKSGNNSLKVIRIV